MWSAGRCRIAPHGTPTSGRDWHHAIVLKAPGLWTREMKSPKNIPGPVTNMGACTVEGMLEASEIAPFPLMLTNLTSLLIENGRADQPFKVNVDGLGELLPIEYESVMNDSWLTEEEKQRVLESWQRLSKLW